MEITDFKRDIQSGKIKALAMLDVHTDVIKDNTYAQMYLAIRKIKNVYDDYFTLETYYNDDEETECEAYYNAFTKYTGNSVSNGHVFYQVFN